jgi:hypothetical protein
MGILQMCKSSLLHVTVSMYYQKNTCKTMLYFKKCYIHTKIVMHEFLAAVTKILQQ